MNLLSSRGIYVILGLLAGVAYDQFYRVSTKNITKNGAFAVILEGIAGISILLLMPLFGIQFPTDIRVYIFFGLAIIFYAINDRLNPIIRAELEVSEVSIINQLATVFMIVLGLIFLKEPFAITKIIGAAIIIISNILLFYEKGKFKINKTVVLALIGNVCMTVALFLDVNISNQFNLPMYTAISLLTPAVLIFIIERIKFSEIREEFKNSNKKTTIIAAISWGLYILFSLRAYQIGEVTTIAPLFALIPILNVIFRICLLKRERKYAEKDGSSHTNHYKCSAN